jgi:hypothetical protein
VTKTNKVHLVLFPSLLGLGRSYRASAFNIIASTHSLHLEDLWQRRRPPTVVPSRARSFFRNELDPRKTQRLQNAEGPKNTFPELVIKKRLKYFERRAVHCPANVGVLAVRLLPQQHYISRKVGEELPQHSLSLHCCAVKNFNQSQSFPVCSF